MHFPTDSLEISDRNCVSHAFHAHDPRDRKRNLQINPRNACRMFKKVKKMNVEELMKVTEKDEDIDKI